MGAELTPSVDATIVVTPVSRAVTRPVALTVATFSFKLRQTTGTIVVSPAFVRTVAVSVRWNPRSMANDAPLMVIEAMSAVIGGVTCSLPHPSATAKAMACTVRVRTRAREEKRKGRVTTAT
jgi:hypothetical protein